MWSVFKETMLKPLLLRLGTMGAAALVVGGQWLCENWNACGLVTEGGAEQVARYVVAVALLLGDLAVEWALKRRAKGAR